jgi:hypothetical protein
VGCAVAAVFFIRPIPSAAGGLVSLHPPCQKRSVVTTIDALFFSWLKQKFGGNLWAAILAHGFYNTIGVLVFYFTGPIYGLW